jgi:hypothetical protein
MVALRCPIEPLELGQVRIGETTGGKPIIPGIALARKQTVTPHTGQNELSVSRPESPR